ncbi:MAG: glucosyltransferase domain-containing protein [Treponemataceae bacterium]|nr:glucosyltransferase domain-containing protein [Treponemataceae bacterium]
MANATLQNLYRCQVRTCLYNKRRKKKKMRDLPKTYLDEKHFSFKNFLSFLKENKLLVFISIITLIIVFGVKLTNICFGIDSEIHIAANRYLNWMEIGRFGLVGLQKLWSDFLPNQEFFNPFLAIFLGCSFLLLGTLLWCFTINLFSNGSIKNICYIPFAVLFISHQVWTEQVYFVCQNAECLFIVLLSPLVVYLLFKGSLRFDFTKIAIGLIINTLCISVYQGITMLVYCGIFAMFILFKENSNLNKSHYIQICTTLIFLLVINTISYFTINKIVKLLFHIKKNDYLTNMITIADTSIFRRILHVMLYVYNLIFANIQPLNNFVKSIVAKVARTGWNAAEQNVQANLITNILYAPMIIIFFIQIIKNKKKSFLYIMSAICVLLSILTAQFIGGGSIRSQYVLPFSFSFILLYATNSLSNSKYTLIYKFSFLFFMLCGTKQVLISSMLNYSDVMRYKADCRLCFEISEKITSVQTNSETPVLLYGMYKQQFSSNYLKGTPCGYSPFEWDSGLSILDSTSRGIAFMKTQGYNFIPVTDENSIKKARIEAANMSDFPLQGCVKNLGDVIVVRLSESPYKEK